MVNEKPGVRRNIKRLIKERYSNATVLEEIKRMFPRCRTRPEQVRAERQALRERWKNIPTSVEARREERERAGLKLGK